MSDAHEKRCQDIASQTTLPVMMSPAGSATPRAPQSCSIRALFVHGHYRQCIQACREALQSDQQDALGRPLRHAVIAFYLGLAHDELARLMHTDSPTKLLAFQQAEEHFKAALYCFREDNLPIALRSETLRSQGSERGGPAPATPEQKPQPGDKEYDPFNYASPSFTSQAGDSHTNQSRRSSSHASSPPDVSRDVSGFVLGTDSSFGEISPPTNSLERDSSSMSLSGGTANRPLKQTNALLRTVSGVALTGGGIRLEASTSESLMRSVQPVSPPQAYQMPPRPPRFGNGASTSRLPKLKTRNLLETSKRTLPAAIAEEEPSGSPVSPLPWGGTFSDISAVSPVSPITPYQSDDECDTAQASASGEATENEAGEERLEVDDNSRAHLVALRIQIVTHLRLLSAARDRTLTAQTARSAKSAQAPGPTSGTPLPAMRGSLDGAAAFNSRPCSALSKHDSVMGDSRPRSLLKGHGKPAQVVGKNDWQRRIEAGRSRGWQQQRFDASKYLRLADEALAEL